MILNKDIFNMICYFINYKNCLIDYKNFGIENENDNSNKKLNEIKKLKISKTNYDFFDNFSETIIDCLKICEKALIQLNSSKNKN